MSLLRNFVDRAKGQAISVTGKQILGRYLEPYGTMLHFSVDPENKTIRLEMLPKGEKESITVHLSGYEVVEHGPGKSALRVEKVTASREWLEVALQQYVQGKAFELPANVGPMLKLLL